jgi:hypothetical protein
MAAPRYQHTIILPEELEQGIAVLQAQRQEPESFNAFINRLIRQEMELLCVTAAPISTIPSEM